MTDKEYCNMVDFLKVVWDTAPDTTRWEFYEDTHTPHNQRNYNGWVYLEIDNDIKKIYKDTNYELYYAILNKHIHKYINKHK